MIVQIVTTKEFYALKFPKVINKMDALWSWKDRPYKSAEMAIKITRKFGKTLRKGISELDENIQEEHIEISNDVYNCICNLIKVEKLKLLDKLPEDILEEDSIEAIDAIFIAVAFADTLGK